MIMSIFEAGRLCVKIAGREACRVCVVVNKADTTHVIVTGPRFVTGIRRRKCNIEHLEPLTEKLKIKADASDSDVMDALKKEDEILKKFELTVPTAEEIK